MAKASRKTSRKGKYRKARGGGLGQGYAFTGAPIVAGLGNAAVNQPVSSCMAAPRDMIAVTPGGLPGQFGGRYGFDLTAHAAPSTPFLGGIPQVMAIPCEAARSNPLNTQAGGVGGIDSAFYAAPTAGYTQNPSTWVGQTGAPSLLSIPYDARGTPTMNPACLKTGGGKSRKAKSRKSRKTKAKKSRR